MRLWNSLTRRFVRPRGAEALQALAEAYRDVFLTQRTATDAQKELVLADLQNFAGWQKVSGMEFGGEQRAFMDGMRATYGRLFRFLRMGDAEVRLLEEAARAEAILDREAGEM